MEFLVYQEQMDQLDHPEFQASMVVRAFRASQVPMDWLDHLV